MESVLISKIRAMLYNSLKIFNLIKLCNGGGGGGMKRALYSSFMLLILHRAFGPY